MATTAQIVAMLLDVLRPARGLRWVHGQGSSILGFSESSDVDIVLVWQKLPSGATTPKDWSPRTTPHHEVMLEQAGVAGRDVDLLHVRQATFLGWADLLERGEGWQGNSWPSPLYSVSGLAHGTVLHDPHGEAAALRHRSSRPSAAMRASVGTALENATPVYLAELGACADRGDHWLHQHLATELLKIVHVAWFVGEGHLPPFPKHVSRWYERLHLDHDVIALHRRYWSAPTLVERNTTLAVLCRSVLRLAASGSVGRG